MVVAVVSGATSAGFTRDPQKVVFNVANYVLSTFVAGLVYLALTPAPARMHRQGRARVLRHGSRLLRQHAAAGRRRRARARRAACCACGGTTTSGRCPATSPAPPSPCSPPGCFELLGIAGLVLALPPVVLIYYSYEIYVSRARERVTFDVERDSFQQELATSVRAARRAARAQLKVAAEIERARRIQTDLLPAATPQVGRAWSSHSASPSSARWAATTTTTSPAATARLAIVCGDVMGKGLAAALIMAMARSLLHDAIAPGKRPRRGHWPRSTTVSRATSRASVCPTS